MRGEREAAGPQRGSEGADGMQVEGVGCVLVWWGGGASSKECGTDGAAVKREIERAVD